MQRRSLGLISFTELGIGTAPLGNLYRAITDDEAHKTLQAMWGDGRPPTHNAAAFENHDFVDFLRANGAAPNLPEPIVELELENVDLRAGRIAMFGCNTCHEVTEGKPATGPHVGPTLLGVFGAPRGCREDYRYSKAMEELDGIWTAEALNAFLADPTGVVPGAGMLWAPDMTREERIGVIAILRNAAE